MLYSNDDALVTAFVSGAVDLAWNGPLAYVQIRRALAEPCRVVARRDIDVGFPTQGMTPRPSSMQQMADLLGRAGGLPRRTPRAASAGKAWPPAGGAGGRARGGGPGAANCCCQRRLSGLPGARAGSRAAARGRWSG